MGKKIKIIDILCYISTGEKDKIPKKIKWRDSIWEYDDRMQDYTNGYLILFEQLKIIKTKEFLNDEVEILDEEDEFEDIEEIPFDNGMKTYDISTYHQIERMTYAINDLIKNQNKIIEKLNNQDNN